MTSLRTPLSRVEGLGSARMGTRDFWQQRLTAVALIPLAIWFALSALAMVGGEYKDALAWLRLPWNALLLILFVLMVARHLTIGMQVIVEDYIHGGWKIAAIVAVKFGTWLIAAVAVFMVLGIVL
jgi:succinate dehydrogenase / fumarate reductase membrane anchor subunit